MLDFIYVWRYNGMPEDKIVADIREWARHASRNRLRSYSSKYPSSGRDCGESGQVKADFAERVDFWMAEVFKPM